MSKRTDNDSTWEAKMINARLAVLAVVKSKENRKTCKVEAIWEKQIMKVKQVTM